MLQDLHTHKVLLFWQGTGAMWELKSSDPRVVQRGVGLQLPQPNAIVCNSILMYVLIYALTICWLASLTSPVCGLLAPHPIHPFIGTWGCLLFYFRWFQLWMKITTQTASLNACHTKPITPQYGTVEKQGTTKGNFFCTAMEPCSMLGD